MPMSRSRRRLAHWVVATTGTLALGGALWMVATREELQIAASVRALRRDPTRVFEFVLAPPESVEQRALERFAATLDGREAILGAIVERMLATLQPDQVEIGALGRFANAFDHVDRRSEAFDFRATLQAPLRFRAISKPSTRPTKTSGQSGSSHW